jgi:hypothetical protein
MTRIMTQIMTQKMTQIMARIMTHIVTHIVTQTMTRTSYGAASVFVATDDAGVVARLRAALPRLHVAGVEDAAGGGDADPAAAAAAGLADRGGTTSGWREEGVAAAKWIEHRLQARRAGRDDGGGDGMSETGVQDRRGDEHRVAMYEYMRSPG